MPVKKLTSVRAADERARRPAFVVILSKVKDLGDERKILRYAPDNNELRLTTIARKSQSLLSLYSKMRAWRGRSRRKARSLRSPLAVPREMVRVSQAWLQYGVFGLPVRFGRALVKDPGFSGPFNETRLLDLFGDNALALFDALGPIYGKAGQMLLSRLSPPLHEIAASLRLTRLYKDWPPLPFAELTQLLDEEIPHWRRDLKVERTPLGVASLAQVHGARDMQGREWVIKVIKPQARKRLLESIAALEQVLATCQPLALTLASQRLLQELAELCVGFRQELSLTRERETIGRVREKLQERKQRLLLIPAVNESFCTDRVLVVQRFRGTSLADVVAGKTALPPGARQKLARAMLSELLVQVFELGLFHADPHAGNLILTEDGAVGLFDWGLSGELSDMDRRHIAAILRAVMTLNMEALIDVLVAMAEEGGQSLTRAAVRKELQAVAKLIKRGQSKGVDQADQTALEAKKPSLQQLLEACLNGAARLGIAVPEGLLMMAKSLVTIEGLAKGLDPSLSLARIATPVLWRAAKPGFKDFITMGRRLPEVARQFFRS